MGPSILACAFGYLVLTLVFASLYASYWRARPAAFHGFETGSGFGDFLSYSVVTIATVGYGDIYPVDGPARFLVCLEILLGVAWTIVVFAAVMLIVQKALERRQP